MCVNIDGCVAIGARPVVEPNVESSCGLVFSFVCLLVCYVATVVIEPSSKIGSTRGRKDDDEINKARALARERDGAEESDRNRLL